MISKNLSKTSNYYLLLYIISSLIQDSTEHLSCITKEIRFYHLRFTTILSKSFIKVHKIYCSSIFLPYELPSVSSIHPARILWSLGACKLLVNTPADDGASFYYVNYSIYKDPLERLQWVYVFLELSNARITDRI